VGYRWMSFPVSSGLHTGRHEPSLYSRLQHRTDLRPGAQHHHPILFALSFVSGAPHIYATMAESLSPGWDVPVLARHGVGQLEGLRQEVFGSGRCASCAPLFRIPLPVHPTSCWMPSPSSPPPAPLHELRVVLRWFPHIRWRRRHWTCCAARRCLIPA